MGVHYSILPHVKDKFQRSLKKAGYRALCKGKCQWCILDTALIDVIDGNTICIIMLYILYIYNLIYVCTYIYTHTMVKYKDINSIYKLRGKTLKSAFFMSI